MPTVTLNAGEVLEINISGTDHAFEVHAASEEYPDRVVVVETGGISGDDVGEADEVLYSDQVTAADDEDEDGDEKEGDDDGDEKEGDDETETDGDDEDEDDEEDDDDEEEEEDEKK